MTKTICFDFGNTRLKAAIFYDEELKEIVYLKDDLPGTVESILKKFEPQRSILSSVINHNADSVALLSQKTEFHQLNHLSKLLFTTPVGKPETIGADRLALAAAAVHYFPGKNNLVIGLGSCITYNFINKFHEFLGGSISPGLEMRLKSVHQFTVRLPLVKATWNVPLIGYDTNTNITSGIVLGIAKEIDGIVEAYSERFSNFNVLLTGGDIVHLGSHLKKKIFADPELIFKGLYAISKANNP
jgi:type III pantothenate kinase